MPFFKLLPRARVLALTLAAFSVPAASQGPAPVPFSTSDASPANWQESLDLHTAAAAAATVLHARCSSGERQQDARAEVARRFASLFSSLEQSGIPSASSQPYAQESFRLKVLAMWQSSQGLPCSASSLPRLRDLANWGQYTLPFSVR